MRANDEMYPEIEPYRTHRIDVDPPHVLYVEECGREDGLPALFLHGGPGGGAKPAQRRTFDPTRFRAILFDQRGCGRSTPSAELDGNHTDALIADIERIRERLGIARWLVCGGSWGSFLSLAYAIAHPDRCLGLRLHGIFLAAPSEVRHWFHGNGLLFPEAFEEFAGQIPEAERDDLLKAYYTRLIDADPAVHMPAAQALRGFSAQTQTLVTDPTHIARLTEPRAALEISRIFTHYCINGAFRPEGALLSQIDRIRHLPCEIVQGRYDVVTPPTTAWQLAKAWPEARFTLVEKANHVATPGAPDLNLALADATDRLADLLDPTRPSLNAYFDAVADQAPALSADGTVLAWISDDTGVGQIWTRTLPDGAPALRLSTPEKVTSLAFRPETNDLFFTMDAGGDERHQLWLLADGADTATPLVHDPRFMQNWGCFDAAGARMAWASHDRMPADMDVKILDLASGAARTLLTAEGWRTPRAFSPDGTRLLIEDNAQGMHHAGLTLLDIATGGVTPLLDPAKGQIAALRWAKSGTIYIATNRGAEYVGIATLDPATGVLTWLFQTDSDVEQMAVSRDESRIAFAVNRRGLTELALLDLASGAVTDLPQPPEGRALSLAFQPSGNALTVVQASFTAPNAIYSVPLGGAPVAAMVQRPTPEATQAPREILAPAEDGTQIPAFVFGQGSGPVLFWIHGGPESQFAAHWRADLQYLISRGWRVIAPNVRGSTGYGRAWQDADDRENRMVAVRDAKAVRDWAVAELGVDRIALGGQSYGGFMTLSLLTEYPDDWHVAVDLFGFVDFVQEVLTTAHYRRTLRAVEYGDPRMPEDRPWLEALSPVHKLDRITAPLFIAHGLEDPRVPPSESEVVSTLLRSRGHPHEILRIPGEGHGFVRRENRKRVYGRMTGFLIRHLGTGQT